MNEKRLLIIDDDETFLGTLKTVLEKNHYHVTACGDPMGAKHIFSLGDFDAVISDVRLGGSTSGLDLLTDFKTIRPNIPFMLMTGFSQIMETLEAEKLGASGFLSKPFKQEMLLDTLNRFFSKPEVRETKPVNLDDLHMKLNIDDFISGKEMKFDIFVRLNAGKYIKIAHEGDDIPKEQILVYKSKGLTHLYLRKEDFKKYLDFNLRLSSSVIKSNDIDKTKKLNFLKHTNELILDRVFADGIFPEAAAECVSILNSTLTMITDHDDCYTLLNSLNSHSDYLYAHSIGVALYSSIIAKEFSYDSKTTISKVCMAGVFHDIGKKEIARSVLDKSRLSMTAAEIQLYESHPMRGLEILTSLKEFSSDVIQIIVQHHENCSGTGYPMKLNRTKIHPIAKIVATANDFCSYVIDSPHSKRIKPAEAIEKMLIFTERYDRLTIKALMSAFKIQPPEGWEARYGISE